MTSMLFFLNHLASLSAIRLRLYSLICTVPVIWKDLRPKDTDMAKMFNVLRASFTNTPCPLRSDCSCFCLITDTTRVNVCYANSDWRRLGGRIYINTVLSPTTVVCNCLEACMCLLWNLKACPYSDFYSENPGLERSSVLWTRSYLSFWYILYSTWDSHEMILN